MQPLFKRAAECAGEFVESLPERRVKPPADLSTLRLALAVDLRPDGEPAGSVLDALVAGADPGIMANAGPRFFGFVVGGSLPVSIAADWMAATWDQNAGIYVLAPAAAVVEEVAAKWLLQILRLPEESSVGFVTGAQMANFTALAAARYEMLRRSGWNVNEQGLWGAPRIEVIAGGHVHVTVLRALRYLGMGASTVRLAEADDQGRMRPESLQKLLDQMDAPAIVCAQAGNVNSGAVDPLPEIIEIAHRRGAWVHVDGAFGLWAACSPRLRDLVRGADGADSWATDAHKWLNVPQDSGIVIVRDRAAHRASVSTDAEYLIKSAGDERDAVDWVPEFSRRARGFAVYAALRHLGTSGVAAMVERCSDLARRFSELLAASPHVQVLNDVVLNQALVRFAPAGRDGDEFTRAVIRRIQDDGTCWLGGTTWRGQAAMRISVSNWSTTEEDVARSAEAVLRCVEAELA
jgi:glutamate/tyrosine decarboxylase-like PLP-dependent enzyme